MSLHNRYILKKIIDYVNIDVPIILKLRLVCKSFLNTFKYYKWNIIVKPKPALSHSIIGDIFWKNFSGVDLSNYYVTSDILKMFIHCDTLKIKGNNLNDSDYKLLKKCKKLNFSKSNIKNHHLKYFHNCKYIDISYTDINDSGLHFLTHCKQIVINGNKHITLNGLEHLPPYTKIYTNNDTYNKLLQYGGMWNKMEREIIINESCQQIIMYVNYYLLILTVIIFLKKFIIYF